MPGVNIEELSLGLREAAQNIAKKHGNLRTTIQVVATVATLLAGLFQVFFADSTGELKAATNMAQGLLLVFAFVCGVSLLFTDASNAKLLVEADKALEYADEVTELADEFVDDLEESTSQLVRAQIVYDTTTAFANAVDQALIGPLDEDQRIKLLYTLLEVLIRNKNELFGMGDEQWNFAVYEWDDAKQLLVCRACRRMSKADEEAHHRDWAKGQGQVGKTFHDRRRFICPDGHDPKLDQYFTAPNGQTRASDKDKYRSIAAFPVMLTPNSEPTGVVIASSDQPNRFDFSNAEDPFPKTEPLAALARTLATIHAVNTLR